jgi:tripartite-type tricarboxylate transporter receptor subunit TctC
MARRNACLSKAALLALVLSWAPSAATLPAGAQQAAFPSRPITLIVPFAPGGATDIVARLVATHIRDDLGQPLVIDNRTGGGGNIGTVAAARSAPDGYTLVLGTTTQLINHFLTKTPVFDIFNDLVPVALIADAPELVAISAKLPIQNLREFVSAAQASATGFNYGSAGMGSVPHLGGEVMARQMKTKMVHVPFRGSADAAKDVAAGNIELTLATQASIGPFVESGLIRVIAIAAPKRFSTLPNVPTTAEAGLQGVELSNWFGIFAPRGTSPEVISRLNRAFNKALALPEVDAILKKQGIDPVRETPTRFAARLQDDARAYRRIVEEVGLAPK